MSFASLPPSFRYLAVDGRRNTDLSSLRKDLARTAAAEDPATLIDLKSKMTSIPWIVIMALRMLFSYTTLMELAGISNMPISAKFAKHLLE